MRLPEPFVARMREELGAEQGAALCAALDTAPPTSLRWNPAKTLPAERCGEPVPWSPEGRYLPSRPQFTLDSDLHAGAYYVQEASSQFLAHLLTEADIAGARVLDLCAAPGGKSTLYASLVGGDGLVVANEINRQRASVLADNVRRWGSGNTVVTLADPAAFGGFAGWFDVVGVDAPCSGEGMFRKLEQARAEWSAQQVGLCARRQREIIRQAWPLLRPGGLLIYSTCTFNREENERTLEDFAAEAGGELVATAKVACPESWGVVCGEAGPFQTFRFYPHRARGEGFFAAVARKSFDAGGRVRTPRARRPLLGPVSRRDCAELGRWLREPRTERLRSGADRILLTPGPIVPAVAGTTSPHAPARTPGRRGTFPRPFGTFLPPLRTISGLRPLSGENYGPAVWSFYLLYIPLLRRPRPAAFPFRLIGPNTEPLRDEGAANLTMQQHAPIHKRTCQEI